MVSGDSAGSPCRVATGVVLVFIYVPLALVVIYAFNESGTSAWPPSGFTLQVGRRRARQHRPPAGVPDLDRVRARGDRRRDGARRLASLAVARYSFFGRRRSRSSSSSPIALPGIVTGMALSTTFASLDLPLGFLPIIVGHATFCVVLVYNNAIARLRRTSRSSRKPPRTSAPTPSRRSGT